MSTIKGMDYSDAYVLEGCILQDISASLLVKARSALGPLVGQWTPGVSSDDQKDAYHAIPNLTQQLNFCVIDFLDVDAQPATMCFCFSWGHVFGFKAAVNNYNRLPQLGVAAMRRTMGILGWHYFDDIGVLSFKVDCEGATRRQSAADCGEVFRGPWRVHVIVRREGFSQGRVGLPLYIQLRQAG